MRVFLAGLVGGVVLQAWGFVAWMVLPIHDGSMGPLADEQAVVDVLKSQDLKSHVYVYPPMPELPAVATAEEKEQAQDVHKQKHRQGPFFTIFYESDPGEAMPPAMMGRGFIINWINATIAALIVWCAAPTCRMYLQRVGLVFLLGLFASIVAHVNLWNWMHFPLHWTMAMSVDAVIGWTIAGLAIAAIVKAPAKPTPAET